MKNRDTGKEFLPTGHQEAPQSSSDEPKVRYRSWEVVIPVDGRIVIPRGLLSDEDWTGVVRVELRVALPQIQGEQWRRKLAFIDLIPAVISQESTADLRTRSRVTIKRGLALVGLTRDRLARLPLEQRTLTVTKEWLASPFDGAYNPPARYSIALEPLYQLAKDPVFESAEDRLRDDEIARVVSEALKQARIPLEDIAGSICQSVARLTKANQGKRRRFFRRSGGE